MLSRALILCALAVAWAPEAAAQPDAEEPPPALDRSIAVMKMDALGMDAVRVARLETLFRKELERLAGAPLPSLRDIDEIVQRSRRLRACGARDACLAAIGKKLGVELVVSGNFAALGDSYVVDIKVVDASSGEQIRRISSDPLRGDPDELIEAVRVAAYRLLAPDRLRGAISVLTDLVGARVSVDGEPVGATPLPGPITDLDIGEHRLTVEADGYDGFDEQIEVRFQKTSRVVVKLVVEQPDEPQVPLGADMTDVGVRPAPRRWYQSTWFYVGAGITAAVVGGYVGYRLSRSSIIDCSSDPVACTK